MGYSFQRHSTGQSADHKMWVIQDYGYRYYEPVTGRWVSRDPIEERGGVSLYALLKNDSINDIDILGNRSCGLKAGQGNSSSKQSEREGVYVALTTRESSDDGSDCSNIADVYAQVYGYTQAKSPRIPDDPFTKGLSPADSVLIFHVVSVSLEDCKLDTNHLSLDWLPKDYDYKAAFWARGRNDMISVALKIAITQTDTIVKIRAVGSASVRSGILNGGAPVLATIGRFNNHPNHQDGDPTKAVGGIEWPDGTTPSSVSTEARVEVVRANCNHR